MIPYLASIALFGLVTFLDVKGHLPDDRAVDYMLGALFLACLSLLVGP